MANLNAGQLTEIRQRVAATGAIPVTYTKPQINAAVQAVEDYFETTARAGISAAIEAVEPGTFTAAQKRQIAKMWLFQKYGRE